MNIALIIIILIVFVIIFSFVWKVTKVVFRFAVIIIFIILVVSFISVSIDDVVQITADTDLPFKEMVNSTIEQVKNSTVDLLNLSDSTQNTSVNET
jgi:regulatory protein YycI of two-component signal transduction system YycFG